GGSAGSLNGKTGHLTKIVNHLDTNKNREYEFDALGRLTKAKGGPTGNLSQQNYTYDRYGNRTNVTATGVAANGTTMPTDGIPNLAFNAASNRITTSNATGEFRYDSAGNQIQALADDGVTWVKYEYDAANRIQIVKKDDANQTLLQSFQYGSTNTRLMDYDYNSNQLKIFANEEGSVLAEYTEFASTVPTWTKSYVYLGENLLSTTTPSGPSGEYSEFHHPDRLGTRIITNQQLGSSYEQVSLPFGTALNAESSGSSNIRFTSYDRSARTGLDYALNRTYDSKQGRFTQVDPIGMNAVDFKHPQTLNLYNYCGNDPINYTDPSGLFWGFLKKLFKWIMVAIAVIVAILTIIAAPATIAGILGAISAGAGAASSVLGSLGYQKAARIFGLIALVTGFGSLIAGKIGKGSYISVGKGNYISDGTGAHKAGTWFGIFAGVGAIANSFAGGKPKKYRTAQEAAIAFLKRVNPRSIRINREIAAVICKLKNGRFRTGRDQVLGKGGGIVVNDCPGNSELAGGAHAHARHDAALVGPYGDGNEVFSPTDGHRVFGSGTPEWIATPSGDIHRLNPDGSHATVSKLKGVGRTRRR
ncbi:MAG: DUF4329 domain-containing protein, partial [Rudanella sp.]|nr:DUF4329 domain-containing protein [Rudanella sp.]